MPLQVGAKTEEKNRTFFNLKTFSFNGENEKKVLVLSYCSE